MKETEVGDTPMFLYVGDYESVDAARADLGAVEEQTRRAKKEMKKEVRAEAKEIEKAISEV